MGNFIRDELSSLDIFIWRLQEQWSKMIQTGFLNAKVPPSMGFGSSQVNGPTPPCGLVEGRTTTCISTAITECNFRLTSHPQCINSVGDKDGGQGWEARGKELLVCAFAQNINILVETPPKECGHKSPSGPWCEYKPTPSCVGGGGEEHLLIPRITGHRIPSSLQRSWRDPKMLSKDKVTM